MTTFQKLPESLVICDECGLRERIVLKLDDLKANMFGAPVCPQCGSDTRVPYLRDPDEPDQGGLDL